MDKKYCKFCKTLVKIKNDRTYVNHMKSCQDWKIYKKTVLTKEFLESEYLIQGKSAKEISGEHGLSSSCSIDKLLTLYQIPKRSIKESKTDREKEKRRKTNLLKTGVEHNFCRNHPSRKKWEQRLLDEEGITNVRQRESVKLKCVENATKTKIEKGLQIPPELKSEWLKYKQEVMRLSENNYKIYYEIINSDNKQRKRNGYNLDHIFSIRDGFDKGVPANIIASVENLRVITQDENFSKGKTSEISLVELKKRIDRNGISTVPHSYRGVV